MFRRLLDYFSHNKYRLTIFSLLAGASVFSVVVWRVRTVFSSTFNYGFLIWNLFLAWIPFMIAYFTYTVKLSKKQIYITVPITAFFWLIFFPNAPYILTDFQHLAWGLNDVPVWYDVMLLLLAAFRLAALAGLFLRGLRRRVFFGHPLSLHQSLSFEVVVQILQWLSPLLPRRAFEAESSCVKPPCRVSWPRPGFAAAARVSGRLGFSP